MRTRSQVKQRKTSKRLSEAEENAFISQSPAVKEERIDRSNPRSRIITGRGRPAANGYHRTSMDLPDDLYERVKIAAVKTRRTLREITTEALEQWLKKNTKG